MVQQSDYSVFKVSCSNCGVEIPLAESLILEMLAPERERIERDAAAEAKASADAKSAGLEKLVSELRGAVQVMTERAKKSETNELKIRQENERISVKLGAFELEVTREAAARSEKIRAAEKRRADRCIADTLRDARGETLELNGRIKQLEKQLANAHRSAVSHSRPTDLGLARQQALVEELQARFSSDSLRSAKRGARGVDVIQTVCDHGSSCGNLAIENKDTKTFQRQWLATLAKDMKAENAMFGVLVTSTLPAGVHSGDQINGIFICEPSMALPVIAIVRQTLIAVSHCIAAALAPEDTAKQLYDYVTVGRFGPLLGKALDVCQAALRQLEKEDAYHRQRQAALRQTLLGIIDAVVTVGGDISGLGAEVPPALRVELPSIPRELTNSVTS
ncbi:DUF2130 domain-containing protein [Nocardia sp. NPDC088792]|uniref:DUF2130 domain-containing protein n=1 Tax=Nocardia sp. NPDC088792 TaxID=3364332 RepID=UPI00380F958F